MDFTPTGWLAVFDPEKSTDHVKLRPVEQWGEHGSAMVVDEKMAKLVPALTMDGFKGIEQVGRVAAVVPAAPGWRMRIWGGKDDSSAFDTPIAAWIVDDLGAMTPVPYARDSYLEPLTNQRTEILDPDEPHGDPQATGQG